MTTSKWETKKEGKIKKLERNFTFSNFKEALDFVNKVAELAEDANHHPDILIHGYKKVKIKLWSHDKGGLSEKDSALASKIDNID